MEYFTNEQIGVPEIPSISALSFEPLQKSYLYVLLIGRVIFISIVTILFVGMLITAPFSIDYRLKYLVCALLVIYSLWSFLALIKGFAYKAYALRQKDIVYKSGWIWRYVTTAPFNRVQHVRIDQGPVERKFNLAKLRIFTAGGSSSDMTIPGLRPETAHALKEFIVKQTLEDEEE